jgi:hypothetical protein
MVADNRRRRSLQLGPQPPAGREDTRGRGALDDGVLLSSPVAVGGAFDGRGRPLRARAAGS